MCRDSGNVVTHFKIVHQGISIEMNSLYQGPDKTQRCIKEKSVDDRHKKEESRTPSCRYYLVKMVRLEWHIVKTHKVTFTKYR